MWQGFKRGETMHAGWLRRDYEEHSIQYGTCDGHRFLNCGASPPHHLFLGETISLHT